MTRVLVDASTLIALAQIGELELLRDVFGGVHATKEVLKEASNPDHPEREAVEEAVRSGWLREAACDGNPEVYRRYGVDMGEATLFLAHREGDTLVVDDGNARRFADVKGMSHTGLLGVLVAGWEEGRIARDRARNVLDELAEGDFRMTVELYGWAKKRLGGE
ncbi:MAG: hypothetical protein MAG715_00771 [Methanonatronarchaeales archaeon]|nr:hypothetical protein [Methanonatronarchaeales archaeon]